MRATSRQGPVRSPAPSPALIGLLLALAFLGHDVVMAAPSPALAAERPSPTLTPGLPEPHARSPHPHGCDIGQTASLNAPEAPVGQPLAAAMAAHPVPSRPAALPSSTGATQARSPSAQRAVLQVFRN